MKNIYIFIIILSIIAPKALASSGMIKIIATPGPARITIDGKAYPDATEKAKVYELSPGRHVIRAEKTYYESQQKTVTIRENEVAPTVIFKFKKASGFKVDRPDSSIAGQGRGDLTIITDTPGATVILNGRTVDADVTPLTVRELGEGKWKVEVRLKGKILSEEVLIRPERLTTIRLFFDAKQRAAYAEKLRLKNRQKQEVENNNKMKDAKRLLHIKRKELEAQFERTYPRIIKESVVNTKHGEEKVYEYGKNAKSNKPNQKLKYMGKNFKEMKFEDMDGNKNTLRFDNKFTLKKETFAKHGSKRGFMGAGGFHYDYEMEYTSDCKFTLNGKLLDSFKWTSETLQQTHLNIGKREITSGSKYGKKEEWTIGNMNITYENDNGRTSFAVEFIDYEIRKNKWVADRIQ